MCHMIADTTEELLEMADKIGVQRKWIQDKGEYSEHFDIAKSAKAKAIKHGAIEITMNVLARKINQRPNAPQVLKDMLS